MVVISGLSFVSGLFAQAQNQPPSVGDLKEEQRIIGFANFGDAEFQIKMARERLGTKNEKLAQQSGLWALEQLAYAKRRLERHAPRIEEARTALGFRASEGTRKELRESYRKLRDRYAELEELIDTVASALDQAGYPILKRTVDALRDSSGENAPGVVAAAMGSAGMTGKGDSADPTEKPAVAAPVAAAAQATTPSGQTVTQDGGNVVFPGGFSIAGHLDGNKITGSPYGTIDLSSERVNAQGVHFYRTDQGVLVVPPGLLIAGAKLNPDGTLQFVDGTTAALDNVSVADGKIKVTAPGQPPVTIDPATGRAAAPTASQRSGPVPDGVQLVGSNGQPITVDGDAPPFQNGQREFVRKVYIGARDTILQRETRVTQRLMEAQGSTWKVEETLGETRTWSLRIALQDTQSEPGKLTGTMVVSDAGGTPGLTVSAFQVEDDDGQRPTIERAAAPGSYSVTFTKSGDYTAVAEGTTDWGSHFRLEATFPVGVR